MNTFSKFKQYIIVKLIKAVQKYGKHKIRISGNTFDVSEGVFNPKYYYTSMFMAKNLKVKPEDIVLDIGTGSGIQAITAGQTAARVIAIDINPEAVASAGKNVVANGLQGIVSVLEGDLFSPLIKPILFDLIIFTPPYLEGYPASDFDHALFDPGKNLIRRFFSEAKGHLKPDGYVQMLYSSIADHGHALSITRELGWKHTLIAEEKTFSELFLIYKFTLDRHWST